MYFLSKQIKFGKRFKNWSEGFLEQTSDRIFFFLKLQYFCNMYFFVNKLKSVKKMFFAEFVMKQYCTKQK